jgi:hypothetical protein
MKSGKLRFIEESKLPITLSKKEEKKETKKECQ